MFSFTKQIRDDILSRQEREGWGAKVIDRLSTDLMNEFPAMKGFSVRNLKYMRRFAKTWRDSQFVQQVAARIPWFHHITLLDKVKDRHRIHQQNVQVPARKDSMHKKR